MKNPDAQPSSLLSCKQGLNTDFQRPAEYFDVILWCDTNRQTKKNALHNLFNDIDALTLIPYFCGVGGPDGRDKKRPRCTFPADLASWLKIYSFRSTCSQHVEYACPEFELRLIPPEAIRFP